MAGTSFSKRVCAACLLVPSVVNGHGNADGFAGPSAAHAEAVVQAVAPRRYAARVLVDPRETVGVVLKVNARIVALRDCYVGRPVKRGEVLAEFESAELETIQRSYAELFANLEVVKAFSTTAEEKLIEAQMNLQWRGLSEADVRTLETTRTPVRRLRITAPQDGYLVDIAVAEGQVINPGSQSGLFSLSGTTLFRIASATGLRVEAELPLALAATLKPGATAWLHTSPTAPSLEATVEEIIPFAPTASLRRTVRLRPLADASLLGLRNGQRLGVSLPVAGEAAHAH
jgi:multidrug efflux pump subunit AcrA (membrane-fusion protein)